MGVELEKQRERLANATSGTKDGNLGELHTATTEVISKNRHRRAEERHLPGWKRRRKPASGKDRRSGVQRAR